MGCFGCGLNEGVGIPACCFGVEAGVVVCRWCGLCIGHLGVWRENCNDELSSFLFRYAFGETYLTVCIICCQRNVSAV